MDEEIKFDETTHTYTRNNEEYISVTTLLKKYNLSPDYGTVPQEILQKAAERGTAVHKALEVYIKTGVNTDQQVLAPFISYTTNRNIDLTKASSEELVFDDTYKVAGTIDFQYTDNGDEIIADFKTTSSIHYDSVIWQLSIYNYIKCKGDIFSYYMKQAKVFHINNGRFTVKELPLIEYDEVVKLLTANMVGLDYTYTPDFTSILDSSETSIYNRLCKEINEYKGILKDLESKRKGFDQKIITNMQAQKLHTITLDDIRLTLTESTNSKTIDSNKVKQYCVDNNVDISNFYKDSTSTTRLTITDLKHKTNVSSIEEDIKDIRNGV